MTDHSDFLDQQDAEVTAGPDERKAKPVRSNGHDPDSSWREIELLHFNDVEAKLDQQWLVRGLLQPEQITVVFGPPGCGKTFLCLDVGLHVAAGVDWCGRRTSGGWVIYVAAEAGRSIKNRIAAWKLSRNPAKGRKIRFVAVTTPVDLCHVK